MSPALASSLRSVIVGTHKQGSIPTSALRTLSTLSTLATQSARTSTSTWTPTWTYTCRASSASPRVSCARRNMPPTFVHRRMMGNPAAPQGVLSDIPMDAYHQVSDHTMEQLHDELEELIDAGGEPGYEVEYHSGVLTLTLGPHGTYVINKQPPNKQIWLSSPISGPKRYDITPAGEWTYLRDGITLAALLNSELASVFPQGVHFDLSVPEGMGGLGGGGSRD